MRIRRAAFVCLLAVCLTPAVRAAEPSKALLHVGNLPPEPLTVSAFRVQAASFRNPVFRGTVGPAGVEIPSGELVLALEAKGHAPDLQRLTAPPGAEVAVTYHPRNGWSLLVRCLDAAGGRAPVAGARVSTAGRTETTGGDGLALLAGLDKVEGVKVRHARYRDQDLAAPPAEPGVFLVHDALLEPAIHVTGRVLRDGQPLAGYTVEAVADDPNGAGTGPPALSATTNAQGEYSGMVLVPGEYLFHLRGPNGNPVGAERPANLELADESVDLSLNGFAVTGHVVDESGNAVENARVTLTWESGKTLTGLSGPEGLFELLTETEGAAVFSADKPGLGSSRRQRINVSRNGGVSDVKLVIRP